MKNEKKFVESELRKIITLTISLEAELYSLLKEKPIKFVEA